MTDNNHSYSFQTNILRQMMAMQSQQNQDNSYSFTFESDYCTKFFDYPEETIICALAHSDYRDSVRVVDRQPNLVLSYEKKKGVLTVRFTDIYRYINDVFNRLKNTSSLDAIASDFTNEVIELSSINLTPVILSLNANGKRCREEDQEPESDENLTAKRPRGFIHRMEAQKSKEISNTGVTY